MASALFAVLVGDDTADRLHPAGHRRRGSGAGPAAPGRCAASSSGSMAAITAASSGPSPPSRCSRSAGEEKAFSMGICWSSTMPIRRARGSRLRTASALSSPVMWSAIRAMAKILARRPRRPGSGRGRPVRADSRHAHPGQGRLRNPGPARAGGGRDAADRRVPRRGAGAAAALPRGDPGRPAPRRRGGQPAGRRGRLPAGPRPGRHHASPT